MKLVVVTVNYGSARHVLRALESIVPELEALGDAEAWIVDNASPDDSVEVLRAAIEARGYGHRVRLLASATNGGFGAGNNLAFREALALPEPPDAFFLLNPDATPEPGAIRSMLAYLDSHPEVGVVGGLLRYVDGSPQGSTFRLPSLLGELEATAKLGPLSRLLEEHRIPLAQPAAAGPVGWVSGASAMIRRSVLERVGMFDEGFFLYFEEVDLCRRVRDAGFEIHCEPKAMIEHESGVTTGVSAGVGRLPKYWFDSRARYYRKAFGSRGLIAFNVVAIAGLCLSRTRDFVLGREPERPYMLRDLLKHSLFSSISSTEVVTP